MAPAATSAAVTSRSVVVLLIACPLEEHTRCPSWARDGPIIVGDPMAVVTHHLAVPPQHVIYHRSPAVGMGLDLFAGELRGVPRDQQQGSALLQLGRSPALVHEADSPE